MNNKFCQSCGMPFDEGHKDCIAKEKDGNDSIYCVYCYKNGEFINPKATISDVVEIGVPHLAHKIGEKAAIAHLERFLPTLERWKNQ